ncbi:MAG: tetratricopeptide repeat protein [Spirosomataceae bacterium]
MKHICHWGLLLSWLTCLGQVSKPASGEQARYVTHQLQYADSLFKHHAHESAMLVLQTLRRSLQQHPDLQAKVQLRIGLMLQDQAQYEASLNEFVHSVALYRQVGDSLGVAWGLSCLGNSYQTLKAYPKALACHLQALHIREVYRASEDPIRFSNTYKNLGHIYLDLEEFGTAEQFFLQSLRLKELIPDSVGIAGIFGSLGEIHFFQKHYHTAIQYYLKATRILEKVPPSIVQSGTYAFLAKTYAALKDYRQSEQYYQKAAEVLQALQLKNRGTTLYLAWGKMYAEWKRPQQAISTLEKALQLAQTIRNAAREAETLEALADEYHQINSDVKAFDAMQRSKMIRDSLYQTEAAHQLAEMRAKFETEQKEKEIQRLNETNRQNLRIRNWLITGLAIFLVLSGISIYLHRKRRQAYAELKAEKDKTEALLVEKEHLHVELQQTQIQLISQDKMASLGLMMAGIAHEMNNPLNYVANNVQALQLDIGDLDPILRQLENLSVDNAATLAQQVEQADVAFLRDEIASLLSSIERGTERTIHLVDSLRNFVRNDSDKFTPTLVEEGLDSTLTILHNTYKNYATVHKNYTDVLPIMAISGKLNQVFLNIIYNAVQAIKKVHPESETPTGIIEVSTAQLGNHLHITITDNGCGMDEATQKRIFEPFFTTKPIGEGTGLGLSISYGIIEQHRGSIHVRSAVGRGTTFVIEVPV